MLIFLFTLFFSSHLSHVAHAASPQDVWAKFLLCKNQSDADKQVECTDSLMDLKLVRLEKTKLLEFLTLDFSTSTLRACSDKDDVQPVRALKKTQKALCFDLLGNKAKAQGYILFDTKKSPRISAIKYSL